MPPPNAKNGNPEPRPGAARIGRGHEFEGEISGRNDLVVEGRLRGSVVLPGNDVLIAENASVTAEIQARDVIVRGEVTGNVTASGRAVIEKTGRLDGDLAASAISVEDGARFKGSLRVLRGT